LQPFLICFIAFFNCFHEFLYIFYFFYILLIDFLNNFERSMRFTKYFEYFFFLIFLNFFLNLHAVIRSFCAFYMKINLAILFKALDRSSKINSLLSANNTTNNKFWKIKLIHFDWGLWSYLGTLCPHRATVMHPIIQGVCNWGIWTFQFSLISCNKISKIFWNILIVQLIFIKVQLEFILYFV
jgi:hypothetical protein